MSQIDHDGAPGVDAPQDAPPAGDDEELEEEALDHEPPEGAQPTDEPTLHGADGAPAQRETDATTDGAPAQRETDATTDSAPGGRETDAAKDSAPGGRETDDATGEGTGDADGAATGSATGADTATGSDEDEVVDSWPADEAQDSGGAALATDTEPDERVSTDEESTANLVAIALPDAVLAQEGLLASVRLRSRGQLSLEDAAIVAKEEGGKVKVQETKDMTTVQGALSGGTWGLLGGILLGGPLGLLGLPIGAAAGGIFAKLRDVGLPDEEIQALGEELEPGEAALLLLVEEAHLFHAMSELRRFEGRLLKTTCDDATAQRIADALADTAWRGML